MPDERFVLTSVSGYSEDSGSRFTTVYQVLDTAFNSALVGGFKGTRANERAIEAAELLNEGAPWPHGTASNYKWCHCELCIAAALLARSNTRYVKPATIRKAVTLLEDSGWPSDRLIKWAA